MEPRPFSDHWFEQFLSEGCLMGCRCSACKTLFVPPRSRCAKCHGSDMRWEQVKGTGRLAAFTCIAIGPAAMAEEGYDRDHPYCCGVVELAEKTRVVARIEGVDALHPGAIRIGMPLQVEYLYRESDAGRKTVLAFRPA